jgi:hypothetical protein
MGDDVARAAAKLGANLNAGQAQILTVVGT